MVAYSSSAPGFAEGDVWVISGQSGSDPQDGSGSNGTAYIFAETELQLLEISGIDVAQSDARYVLKSGDTMTGDLTLPGAPTLALHATTKQYVDSFYNSSSISTSDVGVSTIALRRGDLTSHTLTFSSASHALKANRVTASLSQGLGVDTFTYDGSTAAQVQVDTSSLHFRTGATASIVGNVINPSSVIVTKDISVVADSRISSSAEQRNYIEVHDTAHGAGAMELAAIDDVVIVSNADSGTLGDVVFASNISGTLASETMRIINNNSATNKGLVWVQNDVSASNFIGTASLSLKVNNDLNQGLGIETFDFDGSTAGKIVQLDTSSGHFQVAVSNAISSSLTGSSILSDVVASGSFTGSFVGDLVGTASTLEHSASNGVAVYPFSFDGTQNVVISVDTSSQAFADGVAMGLSSASFAGLSIDFSGSNLDFSDANLSGSDFNFSGSTIDFSDVNFSGSNINWSGSTFDLSDVDFAGSNINWSGSSMDFSDVDFAGSTFNLSGSTWNWSGSTTSYDGADLDYSGANINLSGSTWNWSGSNLDFSDANFSGSNFDFTDTVIYANSASYSGSFDFSDATVTGGAFTGSSIEGATFTGSSAFTGSFDFSNANVTGITIKPSVLAVSASSTLLDGYAYTVTSSTAPTTQSLPASPSRGATIKFANMDDRATLLGANGNKIMGRSEDMTLNVEQVSFELIYDDTVMGWVIYGARALS